MLLSLLISNFLSTFITYDKSQAKEGVLGKDDDGRERRHTGGNASGGNNPQPEANPPDVPGNELMQNINLTNTQTRETALSKTNKGCATDQRSNPQGTNS